MPLVQINAADEVPRWHGGGTIRVADLEALSQGRGPIVVMVHGFKFEPGHSTACPHTHILSLNPEPGCWKALSWPRELDFGTGACDEGLGIAFGWNARGTIWTAYEQAKAAGYALAALVAELHHRAPWRPVHALAHSLGARVVLSALPHLPGGTMGRAILLSPAEYRSRAIAALDTPAGRSAEIINVTSRENDVFDFLLERVIRAPEYGDRIMGAGLPQNVTNGLTVQLDDPATLAGLARLGHMIAPPGGRICHWSSYLRPGVFALYRALLRDRGRLPLARLRGVLPDTHAPRWSRLLETQGWTLPLPSGRKLSS